MDKKEIIGHLIMLSLGMGYMAFWSQTEAIAHFITYGW
jgi:hypothetical protein